MGIGPGAIDHLSQKARQTILESQVVVGYNTYIKLLAGLTQGKEIIAYGMTQEIKRAVLAIERAAQGKRVCLVSSGDPGIYGMVGVVLELLRKDYARRIKIEIIPGIMAACACASLLGAPLAHDFAVISLSDLLTDWKVIEERIKAAAKSDFVMVFYNPKSKKRTRQLEMAWEIIKRYRNPHTPVGIVNSASRSAQEARIVKLKEAPGLKDISMVTTIIVGNSQTYVNNGYMITPRGYNFKGIVSK